MNPYPRLRMSLTTRVAAFFLTALALVLLGFSVAVLLLARSALSRHVDERLELALSTLVAATEFHPADLEWEPNERLVTLGQSADPDEMRWQVRSESGALVARSRNLDSHDVLVTRPVETVLPDHPVPVQIDGRPWRILERRLTASKGSPSDSHAPLQPPFYRGLIMTVALDVDPIETSLATLARGAIGLSVGIWLFAALVGRRLCRRALRPVIEMAGAARAMRGDELDHRLPVAETQDELQDLGLAFNGLLARLHEAFESQRRFAGDASHQLRTPLAAMLGQIEVALRRDRGADDYRRVLGQVHDQAAHLAQMVEMLLFLARADAEARLPDLEALDLTSWTRAQEPRWSTLAPGRALLLETGTTPQTVRVHPPLLAQLVDNLVDNAAKYSAPSAPITIALGRESGRVVLAVADRGAGIDPDDLPHLFEPFYRSPRSRRAGLGGVGLGLCVAQRIAASFQATLVVQSSPGQGSRFVLLFPEAEDGCGTLRVERERSHEIAEEPNHLVLDR